MITSSSGGQTPSLFHVVGNLGCNAAANNVPSRCSIMMETTAINLAAEVVIGLCSGNKVVKTDFDFNGWVVLAVVR